MEFLSNFSLATNSLTPPPCTLYNE
uniref:Uncharacterized protein n=1 Tax=Anguilla anguilla TaxID=7936 RepID=A0A0E9S7F4_ANGAN